MKSLSEKNRKIITILLYVFSLVLVVLIINGITAPIEFNKVKDYLFKEDYVVHRSPKGEPKGCFPAISS